MDKQLPQISDYKLENVVKLENGAVTAFADIEYNGLDLNVEEWKKLESSNEDEAIKLRDELDNYILNDERFINFRSKYVQTDLFTDVEDLRKADVKWTSPKQVLAVFNSIIPKLENVIGKEMFKHRFKEEIIDTYIRYKEAMKLCTS